MVTTPREKGLEPVGRRASRRHAAGLAAAGIGLLLVTAGCGARWNDAQRQEVLARQSGQPTEGVSDDSAAAVSIRVEGSSDAAGVTTTTAGATGGGAATGAAADAAGATADVAATAGATANGAKPCAAPSKAPGVTDTTITVGSISTLSGAVPGLGASSEGAARAYVAYRNATGGVCGRELILKTADDGLDNARHRAIVTEMNPQVLGLMGGLGGGDAGSADAVAQFGMPVVNVPISAGFEGSPVVFDINPPFADVNKPIGKFDWLYQQGVRKAALVYTAVDQTRSEVQGKQKPQMIASGIQVVHEQEVPLSTLSYDSAARGVANSGADYLLFLSDGSISASMARSMADTGYDGLRFAEYVTAYGSKFIDLAGPAADGAVSWTRTLPNEEAGPNEEQNHYLEWFRRIAPDQPADTFAADSWASSKAFIDNLEALPGPISREALLAQLRSVTQYDAGGLLGTINLGGKLNNACAVAMQVKNGQWHRIAPAKGFLC